MLKSESPILSIISIKLAEMSFKVEISCGSDTMSNADNRKRLMSYVFWIS